MSNLDNIVPGAIKAAMKEAGASSLDLWMVPRDQIRVLPGFNVRTRNAAYEAHIKSIGESILANGYYKDKPLAGYVAREDGANVIYLTDGHSRLEGVDYAIAKGAEIESLPVVTKPNGTSLEDLTVGLVVSNSGKQLEPIELAEVCKRLVGFGWDEAKIASKLGFTKPYIIDLLNLLAAPKAVRSMVESGTVSAANAVETLKKHGEKAAEVLKSAQEKAAESGKAKVTKKELKPKRDVVSEGVEFIRKLGDPISQPICIELLALVTGKDAKEIAEKVAA